MKKYRCLGGFITSKSDGDRHYIESHKLPELYKINPAECIFYDITDSDDKHRGYTLEFLNSLTDLWPDESGLYILTTPQPQEAE